MKTTEKNITISLAKTFEQSVTSRSAIVNLFRFDSEKVHSVKVDFEDIVFISRSATHQLITEKRKLEKENIQVTFVKINSEIEKMIDAVIKAVDKPKATVKIFHLNLPTQKRLQSFLARV